MADDDAPTTPSPEAIADAARSAIMGALDRLSAEGMPLASLLALQAMKRPDLLLKAMGRFAPSRMQNEALQTIQSLHLQALRELARRDEMKLITLDNDDWLR